MRNKGIDSFRLLAAFSVVSLHVGFYESFGEITGLVIRSSGRWAVPFFFLVSGYFLAEPLRSNPEKIGQQAARSFFVFLVACLLFIPLSVSQIGLIVTAKELVDPRTLILGTYYHLWFLGALTIGQTVIFFLRSNNLINTLVLVVLGSLSILIINAYVPGGPGGVIARLSMYFPFTYFGVKIAQHNLNLSLKIACIVALFGFFGQLTETYILYETIGKNPHYNDFLISTIPFAVGMFFIAKNIFPSRSVEMLAVIGSKFSLGIYIFHPYIIFCFRHLPRSEGQLGSILYDSLILPVTFGISLSLVSLINRYLPRISGIIYGLRNDLQTADSKMPIPKALQTKK